MKKLLIALLSAALLLSLSAGCSGNGKPVEEKDVPLDDILQSVRDAFGEDYLPNTEIPQDMLEAEFGLSADMYEGVRTEMPMIGAHPDRVVIVKAAPGKADNVEAALNEARRAKIENELTYPMNIAKTDAARVERHGSYVAFLLVGASDERMDADDAERAAFAREQAQKAADAFLANFE